MQASGNTTSSTPCPAACRTKFSILARFASLSEGTCSNWTDATRIFFITSNSAYFYATCVKIVSADDSSLSRFDSAIRSQREANRQSMKHFNPGCSLWEVKSCCHNLVGHSRRKIMKKWRLSCGEYVKISCLQVMKYCCAICRQITFIESIDDGP